MEIAGLPLHPLVVHLAVVLVPGAAIAFIATMWHPAWRRAYLWLVVLAAVGGAVGAFVAAQSGEMLEDAIRRSVATRPRFGSQDRKSTRLNSSH